MPHRERRRDQRLTRIAANLWALGASPPEIADALKASPESVQRLLKPLGVPGHLREDKREERKDMTESSEPIRTFEKRLPSLGPDAPPVKFTRLADGNLVVDFQEEDHREPIRELAERAGHDPRIADLPFVGGGFQSVDLSDEAAAADMALAEGSYVQWSYDGGQTTSYGQIVSLDLEGGAAIITPMSLNESGALEDTGRRKVTVSIGLLQPTTARPATPSGWPNQTQGFSPDATSERSNLSDRELYSAWAELSGVDADEEEDAADLSDMRRDQDALHAELARLSNERDSGPTPDSDERTGRLLQVWRRFFGEG